MTTETEEDTRMQEQVTRDNPQPTEIEGIRYFDEGWEEGQNMYEVSFTLYLDAENVEQASERAMSFRHRVANDPDALETLAFYWHLHDHDGC